MIQFHHLSGLIFHDCRLGNVSGSSFHPAIVFPTHVYINAFLKHKLSCVCIVQGMSLLLNFNENMIEIWGINDCLAKIQLISTLSAPVLPTFFLQ